RTRYGGSEARARAACVLLLTQRGTPFLYAGEELGLEDAVIPEDRRLDPGGRDGCRAPIPWDTPTAHGWATADPWLPGRPAPNAAKAARPAAAGRSTPPLHGRGPAPRRASRALQLGELRLLDAPEGVLAYERDLDGDRRLVLINFEREPATPDPPNDSD